MFERKILAAAVALSAAIFPSGVLAQIDLTAVAPAVTIAVTVGNELTLDPGPPSSSSTL